MLTKPTTDRFLVEQARAFLVDRVVEQAAREHTPLSDIEKRMLTFSATAAEPDFAALDAFNDQYNTERYEGRIAGLVHRAHAHDQRQRKAAIWRQALGAVDGLDFYLLSIIRERGLTPTVKSKSVWGWKDLAWILVIAMLLGLGLSLRGWPHEDWERWLLAAVLGIVAPLLKIIWTPKDRDS